MGVGTCKMECRKMLFTKDFKQPMKRVAKVMPVGFTDEDFYAAYKKYYPYMIDEARKMCDDYKRHNALRKRKGYKNIVFFPEPEVFLKQASSKTIRLTRKAHQTGDVISAEELARYTVMLEQDSKKKNCGKKTKRRGISYAGSRRRTEIYQETDRPVFQNEKNEYAGCK